MWDLFVILFVLVVAAFLLERFSLEHALDGVTYDTKTLRRLVEPDEDFGVETVLENKSRMPRMYIKMRETVPIEFAPIGSVESEGTSHTKYLVSTVYLMPRQRLVRTVRGTLPTRGRYFFTGASLLGGDFLGLSDKEEQVQLMKEIVVAPRPIPTENLDKLFGSFIGDISVNRFIHEDPVLTLGFREYTGAEPMRAISWTQTARLNRLMVKNYDHTIDMSVTVILNASYDGESENRAECLEWVYSAARSVCQKLEDLGIPYCLLTNVDTYGSSGRQHTIPSGLGNDHFLGILELLGRASYFIAESFDGLIERAANRAEQGRAHILVTPPLKDDAGLTLMKIKRRTGSELMIFDLKKAGDSE